MVQEEELSKEDKHRVNRCDNYKMTKMIMKAHENFREIEVGEVFYLKYNDYDDRYVSRNWNGPKDKFMVFHKDEDDFVFIKRINASGKLGKEVQCLTTQFYNCTIEPDQDYVDSLIFEDGDYDPLQAQKELNKKRGKARRRNKALEINFPSADMAYEFVKRLNVGDKIYDAVNTYGEHCVEWTVTKINKRPVDQTKRGWNGNVLGNTREDQAHNRHGFSEFVELEIKATSIPKDRKYTNSVDKVTFRDFMDRRHYGKYYKTRMFTPDDF